MRSLYPRAAIRAALLLAMGSFAVSGHAQVDQPAQAEPLLPSVHFSGFGLVIGDTHHGELLEAHPQMNDDTHADCFQLETVEQNVYTITLRSEDFDSYLLVGVGFCQDVLLQYANDDFEDHSDDAQIEFTAEYPFYSVYVNTFMPFSTGHYSLHVEEHPRQEVAASADTP